MFYSTIIAAALTALYSPQVDGRFIPAQVEAQTLVGVGVSEYCSETDPKFIPENAIVFITGIKICAPKYLSPVSFYEVAWRGGLYYVKRDKLLVTDENSKKVESYSDSDWLAAKAEGETASLLLRRQELEGALKAISATASKGLAIVDWGVLDESEYTEGTGVRVNVYNPTKKKIKYIWFTLQAKNPVGDKYGGPKTLRAVGPIEPDAGGGYVFDYVWMSDMVETANFIQIKVQYMDGSIKVISKPSEIVLDEDSARVIKE